MQQDLRPQGYPLRPHVVWFGEAVPAYEEALDLIQDADIFIVIGTGLVVYPVAGLVHEIPANCQAYYLTQKPCKPNFLLNFNGFPKLPLRACSNCWINYIKFKVITVSKFFHL